MKNPARLSNIDALKKALEAGGKELSYKAPQKLENEVTARVVMRLAKYKGYKNVWVCIDAYLKDFDFAFELLDMTDEGRERLKSRPPVVIPTVRIDEKEVEKLDFKKILPKRKP